MAATEERRVDGRKARREKNRLAVIDAMLTLLQERGSAPAVEEVAARADVSVSSVFRYFESLDDLLHQTIDRFLERFSPLFEIPEIGTGPLPDRIERFVDARLELHETVAAIARASRRQAVDEPRLSGTLAQVRRRNLSQVREHFASALPATTGAELDDTIAAVDSLTSFEGWDLLRTGHGRSQRRIRRIWLGAITALLAEQA